MLKSKLILCMLSFLQPQDKPFTLHAVLDSHVSKVLLIRYSLKAGQHIDTLQTHHGVLDFKGMVNDERQKSQLMTYDSAGGMNGMTLFYLEPGNITVTQTGHQFTFGGTALNRDYNIYKGIYNSLAGAHDPNADLGKIVMKDIRLEVIRRFVLKRPGSVVALDELDDYAAHSRQPASVDSVFALLTAQQRSSPIGQQIADRLKGMRTAAVGNPAPQFTLPDTSGKMVSLADFKGKYVLVDFWATWCGPCMAEMPNVKKAYAEYHNKNFEIIGVSLDRPDSRNLWLKVIARDQLVWPQVSDLKWWNSQAALYYNITSVPANFLIAPDGTIIAANLRGEALQQKLAQIL